MKLTAEEARAVIYEDTDDWSKLYETETISNHSRWAVGVECVFQHLPTGKFYEFYWERGATEYQDQQPYEYEKFVEPIEVVEKEVVIKQWVPAELKGKENG
jgi:hypothetical protein